MPKPKAIKPWKTQFLSIHEGKRPLISSSSLLLSLLPADLQSCLWPPTPSLRPAAVCSVLPVTHPRLALKPPSPTALSTTSGVCSAPVTPYSSYPFTTPGSSPAFFAAARWGQSQPHLVTDEFSFLLDPRACLTSPAPGTSELVLRAFSQGHV